MYPDWPTSAADLVPLPQCVGPKLKPFDFQGSPQQIEFLEYLGYGLHSVVIKVKILGIIYALKIFKFTDGWIIDSKMPRNRNLPPECQWSMQFAPGPNDPRGKPEDYEHASTLYNYDEPFSRECRAFGRLQETGHEGLSIRCHGYVLLDEANECAMKEVIRPEGFQLAATFWNCEGVSRSRWIEKSASRRPPPYRAIVKDFGPTMEDLNVRRARSILRDMVHLHQLGIMHLDVKHNQIVSGRLADFSMAYTSPHYTMTPELNPRLPRWARDAMEDETFIQTYIDYRSFDNMVQNYNLYSCQGKKKLTSVRALPNHWAFGQHDLRSTPSRARMYVHVDPRRFDWTSKKAPTRLRATPPRWYYGPLPLEKIDELDWKELFDTDLFWVCRDGLLFPVPNSACSVERDKAFVFQSISDDALEKYLKG